METKMNTKNTIQTFVIALAMMITLTIGSSVAFGQNKADKRSIDEPGNSLVGTWQSVVTSYNCQTGVSDPAPIKSLLTYMQGGTMSEDNNDPIDPYKTSSHGIWKRTTERNYTAVFLHYSFAADGTFTYTIKVKQNITLSRFFDSLTATSTVEVYDSNDNLVFTGCGNETATRLTF
jgi:hypothetical protein